MARVFGLGFSWPDTYTQCVFQTLLADIRHGQPYSQQSCGHLAQILETQDEDTEDDIGGEEIGGDSLGDVFFVPEDLDNYNVLRNSPDIAIIDDDLEHDQQEEAWTQLNHVSTFHFSIVMQLQSARKDIQTFLNMKSRFVKNCMLHNFFIFNVICCCLTAHTTNSLHST